MSTSHGYFMLFCAAHRLVLVVNNLLFSLLALIPKCVSLSTSFAREEELLNKITRVKWFYGLYVPFGGLMYKPRKPRSESFENRTRKKDKKVKGKGSNRKLWIFTTCLSNTSRTLLVLHLQSWPIYPSFSVFICLLGMPVFGLLSTRHISPFRHIFIFSFAPVQEQNP